MRLAALVSLALGFAGGAGTLYQFLLGNWSVMLMVHVTSIMFSGLGLALWLRSVGCNQRGLLLLTMGMIAFVPGFSVLAVPVAAAYGSRNPQAEEEEQTMTVDVPRLPFKPLAFDESLSFSRGGLFEVLERSSDTDKQVVAVMATTRMKSKQAVPLLKVAMRDEADDVRLLAYSIKDRKESEINGKIKRLLAILERTDLERTDAHRAGRGGTPLSARERAATERSLAFLYWELVYLDLAEGDIREFFLAQVISRARAALAEVEYGPLTVLLARAHMELADFEAANEALDAAERIGVERVVLAPYRAEVAFHRGRFGEVRERLLEVGGSPHEALREVLDFWLKAA